MPELSIFKRSRSIAFLLAVIAGGGSIYAQDFTAPLVEVDVYGGVSRYNSWADNKGFYKLNLADGYVIGGRVDFNIASHFALETNYSWGTNNLKLYPWPN